MRVKQIACAMAVALVAVAAVGTASAAAKEVVFKANGKTLPAGTQLSGLSLNIYAYDVYGGHICDGRFESEIAEPSVFEIYEDFFFFPGQEKERGCFFQGKKSSPKAFSLTFAEPVTLEEDEEGNVIGSTPGVINWGPCEYPTTFLSDIRPYLGENGEALLHMSGGERFIEECLGGVEFEGDFRLSSNGEPVTIDVI